MSRRTLVIVGGGGFAREVLDVVKARDPDKSKWDFVGFVADSEPSPTLMQRLGTVWLGTIHEFLARPIGEAFTIGIGDPQVRSRLARRFETAGLEPITLLHPAASLGADIRIGEGSIVCSHVSVTTNVDIGRYVHINLNSTIGHDTSIGDCVTINPLVSVSGTVSIGHRASLGTHSCVLQGLSIGEDAVIGAGAVVVRDVKPRTTVVGVPAKERESPASSAS